MHSHYTVASRFWSKVNIGSVSECWEWTGYVQPGGYGRCNIYGKRYIASRVALFFLTGKWGTMALHTCDNRKCCNPYHLYWGDAKDNGDDIRERDRVVRVLGERHHNSKLTEDDVRTIRRLRAERVPVHVLASRYGMSLAQVYRVATRRAWAHVS